MIFLSHVVTVLEKYKMHFSQGGRSYQVSIKKPSAKYRLDHFVVLQ